MEEKRKEQLRKNYSAKRGRAAKHDEEKMTFGEKLTGAGFMIVLIAGSGLDAPEWEVAFMGVLVGIFTIWIGQVIAKKEGSEYV